MIRAGIVGGTGYTGVELMRILAGHPEVEVVAATSRGDAGRLISDVYPNLRGAYSFPFVEPDLGALKTCDVVLFATPNGTAMRMAPELLHRGIRVIDLAADFRLKDPAEWETWYGEPHVCPELLDRAVYGLPEWNREAIIGADLIACPGCYPTSVQLPLLPLLKAGCVGDDFVIADVKSGVSGAGRKAEMAILMSETGESFKAYSVKGHRHWPEIRQGFRLFAGKEVPLTFVPHLTPMIRGIHSTLYLKATAPIDRVQATLESTYAQAAFVDILSKGAHPDTRNVRGSNRCQIAVHQPPTGDMLVVLSVIDNLVKGAAGQAVQCLNLMFGCNETTGLARFGTYP